MNGDRWGKSHVDARCNSQSSTRSQRQSVESYKQYAQIINDQSERNMTLRGLFS